MRRPQLELPRLRECATGIAIGPDRTPPWVTAHRNPPAVGARFAKYWGRSDIFAVWRFRWRCTIRVSLHRNEKLPW